MQPYQRSRIPRPIDRNELVRRARAHLDLHGYSRIELFVIVALAGVAGFLVSYGLLNGGVHSMPARYAAAGSAAYLAFLLLIRLWIVWKSGAHADFDGAEHLDVLDLAPRPFGEAPAPRLFDGGRSGGGGATASWTDASGGGSGSNGSSWLDWDADSGCSFVPGRF